MSVKTDPWAKQHPVWAANQHDAKKYAEKREVKVIHDTLLQELDKSVNLQDTTESFARALDALDRIGRRTLEHLSAKPFLDIQFHDKSPFVAEEILWVVSHPQAQPFLAIREQERFYQSMNRRVNPDGVQGCYRTLQDRISDLEAAQWAHCKGDKKCYEVISWHREQAFHKYCTVLPPKNIDPYAAMKKEDFLRMLEVEQVVANLRKSKAEAERTAKVLEQTAGAATQIVEETAAYLEQVRDKALHAGGVLDERRVSAENAVGALRQTKKEALDALRAGKKGVGETVDSLMRIEQDVLKRVQAARSETERDILERLQAGKSELDSLGQHREDVARAAAYLKRQREEASDRFLKSLEKKD